MCDDEKTALNPAEKYNICKKCSRAALYEQLKWERDVAVNQLKEIGITLGESMDAAKDAIKNYKDAVNELCYMCGKYENKHLGACEDCRWEQ